MDLITTFQQLVHEVPAWLQPLIMAAAGAVPFIEGEIGASIGILAGMPPIVAAMSAALGNFVCVLVLVLLSAHARERVSVRVRARRGAVALSGAASGVQSQPSGRQVKFQRALHRYGVPGVCLLGPLLLPTQITATMLAAAGVSRRRVLVWQGVTIALWTTVCAVLMMQVVGAFSA